MSPAFIPDISDIVGIECVGFAEVHVGFWVGVSSGFSHQPTFR